MNTATLHNLSTAHATLVAPRAHRGRSYPGIGPGAGMVQARPWSVEIFGEGPACACGSKDPSQEALS